MAPGDADRSATATAIVLGAAVLPDGRASAALERRARHAVALWQAGRVGRILACGGAVVGPISEARVIADICVQAGVARTAITLEDRSCNTAQNLRNAAALLGQADGPLILVTDRAHAPRARLMARRVGLRVTTECPAHPGPLALRAKLCGREAVAYLWYWLRQRA